MRSAVLSNLTEEKSDSLALAQAEWVRAVARWVSSETVSPAVGQTQQNIAQHHTKLLVNGRRLGFGKKFLKARIIADWVPDGIDFQTCNGNDSPRRGCEQLAKYFYRFFGSAGARFDFTQCSK
jgi:hypothetical protein